MQNLHALKGGAYERTCEAPKRQNAETPKGRGSCSVIDHKAISPTAKAQVGKAPWVKG